MPTELVLRPGVASDAAALALVHLEARAAAPMPPSVHPELEVRAWLSGRLTTDEVWVAEYAGRVAGYARLTDAWLDDLYVAPGDARRGIGSALLDLAKSRRPGGFCLWVFESNAPARAFYARHGLVELERTDGSANEEKAPDLRLAWPGEDPVAFLRGLADEVEEQLADLLARRAALARALRAATGPC
ncbi:GNAT family N-acetyltransferase [Nocardioides sp. cx-173]|uniref:GNAT family N-acetyltransferase n=1 Tax=Nocardioides sp. cx-173 TaxID=2898796 RepID=UPI001E47A3C1|nr:GNAT family N-acetyltransferase [Nocardioides sp. cx-173]MCD4526355.1 GNAT family N-acetyltransferase [Nocardioides sp. cx-173]UGB43528.1 GNAT family N-acetyltransferase [Nocardioides sp. cx-173]